MIDRPMSSLNRNSGSRLERSCAQANWIRAAPSSPGLERIEAHFSGHGFDPHRHDTYAIGYTLDGVQAFRYRGAARRSTAGGGVVRPPGEVHDVHRRTRARLGQPVLYL